MRTIHKQPLVITDRQTIKTSKGALLLTVQAQNSYPFPVIWYETDPDAEQVERTILCVGTGHPLPESEEHALYYLATTQDRLLVWHWYEQYNLNG